MVKRKTNYIDAELDWAEDKLLAWKDYIDNNPINLLEDRIEWKDVRGGKVPQVIATIEAQGKFVQEVMKNFLSLLSEVNKMREIEEEKKQARGGRDVPHRMK